MQFSKEFLYFSVYSEEDIQVSIRVKFGFQTNHSSIKRLESQIKNEAMEIKNVNRYLLNEQISRKILKM